MVHIGQVVVSSSDLYHYLSIVSGLMIWYPVKTTYFHARPIWPVGSAFGGGLNMLKYR